MSGITATAVSNSPEAEPVKKAGPAPDVRLVLAPDHLSLDALKVIRISDIVDAVSEYLSSPNIDLIHKAYVYSARVHQGHMRANGEPYLNHPLAVAYILTKLYADEATIAAGLLHDTIEDTWATYDDLQDMFGDTVAQLVDGVTKLSKISYTSRAQRQAESHRKMFVAMAEDLRVMLIKLADRLHNMRTLQYLSDTKQHYIARETMDLYAPIAGRLGIQWIRGELEDLSFRYLDPEAYETVAKAVDARRESDAEAIAEVVAALQETLQESDIVADIAGRQKHLYSIHKKMIKRDVALDQIYDMTAFRVVVENIEDCYAVLGLVHGRWTPVPGRFKDYIAMPKANRYQSLHTTVIGPTGKPIEIQIRTTAMHHIAELGIAAHWVYKEGEPAKKRANSFNWLRQLYDWHAELQDAEQFVETVRVDLFQDEVYVFTPQGDVIELPAGATPLDFAYKVHTEIGNHTEGAKVNGRIASLDTPLKKGDIVEVLTSSGKEPRRDWLKIVKTSAARQKIRNYLNRQEREQALTMGETLLNQAFKEAGVTKAQSAWFNSQVARQVMEALRIRDRAQLVESLGYGKLPLKKLTAAIEEVSNPQRSSESRLLAPLEKLLRRSQPDDTPAPLLVDGLSGIETNIANCCKPLPGDDVVGYVRVGKGIKIHQRHCSRLEAANPDRIVPVSWGGSEESQRQTVQILIECVDSPGVLGKIGHAVSGKKINIVETTIRTHGDGKATGVVSVSVRNRRELDQVISELQKVKGVTSVARRH